jgi:hypothetical protein
MQVQEQDFAAWADLQVEELQKEQQEMRRRAEKRWQVLDKAYEGRMKARAVQGTLRPLSLLFLGPLWMLTLSSFFYLPNM